MRCPECSSPREAEAQACASCGLLFVALPQPHRRTDDQSRQKRRASDVELTECPACSGSVPRTAIRCRHCSEIIDPRYLARKARRRRKQVNAASWTAYLLGLITLFIFRPVGIIAIGAGLMLSILYYLIPVEEDLPYEDDEKQKKDEGGEAEKEQRSFRSLLTDLRRQFTSERFTLRLPHARRFKLVVFGTPLMAAALGVITQDFLLQLPLSRLVDASKTFDGVKVSAHYRYWVIPGVVVYDVDAERSENLDRAVVELARGSRDHDIAEVNVRLKGSERLKLDGEAFRRLGQVKGSEAERGVVSQLRRIFQPSTDGETVREAFQNLQRLTRPAPAATPSTVVSIPISSVR